MGSAIAVRVILHWPFGFLYVCCLCEFLRGTGLRVHPVVTRLTVYHRPYVFGGVQGRITRHLQVRLAIRDFFLKVFGVEVFVW